MELPLFSSSFFLDHSNWIFPPLPFPPRRPFPLVVLPYRTREFVTLFDTFAISMATLIERESRRDCDKPRRKILPNRYIYIYMSAEFHSPPISRASKFARDLSDLEPTNRCDLRGCTTRDWPRFVAFGNEICQRFRSSGTEKLRNACTFPLESLRALLFSPSLPSEVFFVYQQFIYEIVSEVWLQIKWYNIVEIIRSGLNYLGI